MATSESTRKLSSALRSMGAAMIELSTALLADTNEEQDEWITSDVAAQLMGCSRQAATQRAISGKIVGRKVGRDFVFSKQSIENFNKIKSHNTIN